MSARMQQRGMTPQQRIRRGFSRAARRYDLLSSLHEEIGGDLCRWLISEDGIEGESARVLDVGCGTGRMVRRLSFHLPGALVIGLDSARGMIQRAREKDERSVLVQADGSHLPFFDRTFDAVISNLSYQWISDMRQAFLGARACLKEEGGFYATMFGRDTFRELFWVLENHLPGAKGLNRLLSMDEVGGVLMDCGFELKDMKQEFIKVRYDDFPDMMRWIKGLGANTLNHGVKFGKELFQKISEDYGKRFTDLWGMYATWDIIWVRARRRKG